MTCIELYQRIIAEFVEPDTGVLTILPEVQVNALLETPDEPVPKALLQMCRKNAVRESFAERSLDQNQKTKQKTEKTPLEEKLEIAAVIAEERNKKMRGSA